MSKEIVSSTGNLGVSRRSYNRLYVNGKEFSSDPRIVETNFRRLIGIGDRHQETIGRSVFRGLVSSDVMSHVSQGDFRSYLEVALPVREFTGDDSWLVYMAKNRATRQRIVPQQVMVEETSRDKADGLTPVQRIQKVVGEGYTFTNIFTIGEIAQIYALWSTTFGWENEEVLNLQKRLQGEKNKAPSEKTVWFTATKDEEGKIASLAMAERLSMPGKDGKIIDFIESTEWRVRDDKQGNGLMPATIAMLHAQVLSDLQESVHGMPLIFAECNYQARADLSGYAAGLRIPDRAYAPQIIIQNVTVGDGQSPEGTLRDFTFMYLPIATIQATYDRPQREEMLQYMQ